MSTREHFFTKLFSKGDQVESQYNRIDFSKFSDEEKKFLKSLSWYSKYKKGIRNYLTTSKSSIINKRQYLELNQGNLTYEEFCCLERCLEDYREVKDNAFTLFYTSTILLYLITLYKKPLGEYSGRNILKCILTGLGVSLLYIISHRQTEYKRIINRTYGILSDRLNNNPELKFKQSENSKEAYFDMKYDNNNI